MSLTKLMIRRAVRGSLAIIAIMFAWYAASAVAAETAGWPLLAVCAAVLLLLVVRSLDVAARREGGR